MEDKDTSRQQSTGFQKERTMPVNRIVFTGDVLRPNVAGTRPTQHHNIRWLRNLLGTQLEMATNLPVESISWNCGGVQDGRLGDDDISLIYRAFGLRVDIRNWARIHDIDRLPQQVDELFRRLFQNALVVGFEMPPYLRRMFSRFGILYINVMLHPVRFLDDLLLTFSASEPSLQERLFAHRIQEPFIRTIAGLQRAAAARSDNTQIEPDSALFLMQTWYDQSQIQDGIFVDSMNFLNDIAAYAKQYREFLVKEHPLEPNPATLFMAATIPNMRLVKGNTYTFMSRPEIISVGTLSSSVGYEAQYFDKKAQFFLRPPMQLRRGPDDPEDAQIGIQDMFLTADFWREVLTPILPVTNSDGVTVPFKPNRLRSSIRSFWNFNEIDTDIAVRAAKAG
ncbi:hypothetical protein ABMC89_18095 [Sulfitobacter sp. HNIBRBA3233]|uniref:hypothetical protein n=1 Tax=Sulfitobacter marinivivus TaxID=3158558 RepID=UPI0032DFFC80